MDVWYVWVCVGVWEGRGKGGDKGGDVGVGIVCRGRVKDLFILWLLVVFGGYGGITMVGGVYVSAMVLRSYRVYVGILIL